MADVHSGLGHWAVFYKQCKVLEAFLRVEERRQRFVWTCVKDSPWHAWHSKFERFAGSLYEERWHEVINFLRAVDPILEVMRLCWNCDRYVRGIDSDGGVRGTQARAQERQEAQAGLTSFDPRALGPILDSSLFHAYHAMAMKVEGIPDELASRAELCVCHGYILKTLSEYQRRVLLSRYFCSGSTYCPMAGKCLPELIASGLKSLLLEVFSLLEFELHRWGPRGKYPLTAADWNILISNFHAAKSATIFLFDLKTDYMKRLPTLLFTLAHVDEAIARQYACIIKDAWLRDPRPQAHHRKTVAFVQKQWDALIAFIGGRPRKECSGSFRFMIPPGFSTGGVSFSRELDGVKDGRVCGRAPLQTTSR